MFLLCEENMKKMYAQTWGWNSHEKMVELFDDPISKYILIFGGSDNDEKNMKGFVHFKFGFEDEGIERFELDF